MSARTRGLLLVALIALTVGGIAWALREVYTTRYPGGNDLYPRWSGGCGWIRGGTDPYSREATLKIQNGVYGRPAQPGEDQVAFAYPIYTLVLIAPLCLTSDFATAHAVAMAVLLVGVLLSAILARRVAGVAVGGWLWVWILFWTAVSYPSARAVLLGQLAVVVGVLQIAALESLRIRRDVLAGIVLALSTVKPQMALLIVPGLLFWGVWGRRWRFVAAFGVSLALLFVVPMIWLPSWIQSWIGQLQAYPSYTELGSATWILTTYYLGSPPALEILLTAGLCAGLGYAWWRTRGSSFEPMLWVAGLTLVLTHFISPRTATTHFGPLLVPVFMMMRVIASIGGRIRAGWVALLAAGVSLATWILFLATVEGRQESAINYLPIPLGLLLGILWIRRPWLQIAAARG